MNTRASRTVALLSALVVLALLTALLLPIFKGTTQAAEPGAPVSPAPGLCALIVGGGPDKPHNQFAIESNVRYVRRLLPAATPVRVLFADGNPQTPDVQYLDSSGQPRYRASQLGTVDGPARLAAFRSNIQDVAGQGSGPLLLYFTGHGSPDDDGQYLNNAYDMWSDDQLTVKKLAASLAALPPSMPVTLVMVQCFSGAFGNLLFQGGDPKSPLADRTICGFFASVPSREAAGCTAEVNEADYHDFTSYFFAALSGHDRLDRPVSGADYNGDGIVSMNEAYAYTLLHDISIDTPTCTSDVFLRRFIPTTDEAVFQNSYTDIRAWATPAQRAVLDGLTIQLKISGDKRLQTAYAVFRHRTAVDGSDDAEAQTARWTRLVCCAKSVVLAHTLLTGTDEHLKTRYAALVAAESANPLRASP